MADTADVAYDAHFGDNWAGPPGMTYPDNSEFGPGAVIEMNSQFQGRTVFGPGAQISHGTHFYGPVVFGEGVTFKADCKLPPPVCDPLIHIHDAAIIGNGATLSGAEIDKPDEVVIGMDFGASDATYLDEHHHKQVMLPGSVVESLLDSILGALGLAGGTYCNTMSWSSKHRSASIYNGKTMDITGCCPDNEGEDV